jgi:cell division protein ZapE
MASSVATRYGADVAAGRIERDDAQLVIVERMTELEARMAEYRLTRKSSALGWLFASRERALPPIKGMYIYGEVGRGKTMLMDLFFESSPVAQKRRAHFHEFMLDVHERIYAIRQKVKFGEPDEDPIRRVAEDLAAETWLLCFDEFHVTDIADAMILGRLFAQLFERGIIVVATANVPPDELYKDGLNRALFLPFIDMLNARMDIVQLGARTDFRLEKLAGQPVWYVPDDAAADASLDQAWRRLGGGERGGALELAVKGRSVQVPRAFRGVARFSFHDLCEEPLAAAEYLRIAREFHTVILDHVPVMAYDDRNAAKRFIILIDTFYDMNVKLIASAAAAPDALYRADEGFEAREFKRTASRLIEMRSQAYLARPHGAGHERLSGSSSGIVET